MDEIAILIELLSGGSRWNNARDALGLDATLVLPTIIDIRTLEPQKGVRYDMSNNGGGATILVFEDSQAIDYPTIHYDIRNEAYTFTLHIRVLHDERSGFDASHGKDRLRAIYLILRRVLESKRTGYTSSDGSKFNQLFLGSRSESNDRGKKLFGYNPLKFH